MVATPLARSVRSGPHITWDKLPDDYRLPDDPVDNIYQPVLAEALRDGLAPIGLTPDTALLSTNYGICATIDGKIAVKAPDWAYIPQITVSRQDVDRSYTPNLQGDIPVIVMELLPETAAVKHTGSYSIKPTYPVGKWYFYEQILKVPTYAIFDIDGGLLEVYRLRDSNYVLEQPDPDGRHWIAEMGLFLGTWQGQRDDRLGYWLRWWKDDQTLVPWDRERAEQAQAEADRAQADADRERDRADQERSRADRLADYLRSQGLDPDGLLG
jgi:Uma2 family endonuclease